MSDDTGSKQADDTGGKEADWSVKKDDKPSGPNWLSSALLLFQLLLGSTSAQLLCHSPP